MAWSILSLHVFMRSLYPSIPGNLFKVAKLPVVSKRNKLFLVVVLITDGIRYLTISLQLVLSQALKGSLN